MFLLHLFLSDMQKQQVNLQPMGKTYCLTAVTLMHWRWLYWSLVFFFFMGFRFSASCALCMTFILGFLGTLAKDDSWSSCRDGKQKGEATSSKQWSLFFHDNAVFIFNCLLLERISDYDDFDLNPYWVIKISDSASRLMHLSANWSHFVYFFIMQLWSFLLLTNFLLLYIDVSLSQIWWLSTFTGNVEIGNGYGVPGGGAYYAANLPSAQISMPPL